MGGLVKGAKLRSKKKIAGGYFTLILMGAGISPDWQLAQGAEPFYSGKTIQMVVASGPGASTDISARLVGRYLGKHMPGNPSIFVQNMPGAGGLVAANHIYNLTKPDGLTIVAVTRSNYLDQMIEKPEVRFDFRKLA